jgi:hypothetical protein
MEGRENTVLQITEIAAIAQDIINSIHGSFVIRLESIEGATGSVANITAIIWEKTLALLHAILANTTEMSSVLVIVTLVGRNDPRYS